MNTTFLKSAVLTFALILSACSKDDSKPPEAKNSQNNSEAPSNNNSKVVVPSQDIEIGYQEQDVEVAISGGTNLTFKTNDEWLSVKPSEKGITVSVLENSTGAKRIGAIILLENGKEVGKVLFVQTSRLTFPLPLFDFGKNEVQIKEEEQKRSSIVEYLRKTEFNQSTTGVTFKVNNEFISNITYLVTIDGYFSSKVSFIDKKTSDEMKEKFELFLTQEGFEETTIEGYETTLSMDKKTKKAFVNKAKQVTAEFYSDARDPHFAFKYTPTQQNKFATFDALPSITKKTTYEDIHAKETKENSQLVNDKALTNPEYKSGSSTRAKYMYKVVGDDKISHRQHFFLKATTGTSLTQTSFFYENFNLALFVGLDGKYYPTEEFSALLKENGFEQAASSIIGQRYIFTKGKAPNRVTIAVERLKVSESMDLLLRIQVY